MQNRWNSKSGSWQQRNGEASNSDTEKGVKNIGGTVGGQVLQQPIMEISAKPDDCGRKLFLSKVREELRAESVAARRPSQNPIDT